MGFYSYLRSAYWLATRQPLLPISRFMLESQHWDRAKLLEYRDAKVREIVSHCYENVPYYARVMRERGLHPREFSCAADLRKLPVLTKADLRAHAEDLLARNVPSKAISWTRTGGTTGEPLRVAKDRACSAWENFCYERGVAWGGLPVDVPRIIFVGGSLGIDRARWTARFNEWLRRDLTLAAFELRADTAPAYFEAIRRSRLRHVVGYTSAIYRLAVLAEQFAPDVTFDAVFPTAEVVLPEWVDVIRRRFKCDVLPFYGCGEINGIGYSPPPGDSYAVSEDHCVVEIERDGAVAEGGIGEGKFIVTSLVNRAMPLLRYVTGDAGCVGPPSGALPFARITRLDGRYNSLLMTDSGDLISGALAPHIFRHLTMSVESYRIIQREPLRVVIEIVPRGDNFTRTDEDLLRRLFVQHLGRRMQVDINTVAAIPRRPSGKTVFVINELLS
jgi:phenylacetate-CoA ligase